MGLYVPSSVIADGGYAYSYQDTAGSTACLAATALCSAGTTQAPASSTAWGGGIGFNLNQAMATGSTSPPINAYAVATTHTGISYALSALPTQGARIIIDDNGSDYCAALGAATGTVPWASFNTACWNGGGTALAGAPQTATHLQFEVTASNAPAPFDFCVTAVSFAQ
jgi:hypothetical protein